MARRRKQTIGRRISKAKTSLTKSVRRVSKRINRRRKSITKTIRRAKRKTVSRIKKLKRISRKQFRRLSKARQLRGSEWHQRRQERRQEIKGSFDTSKSRIVQASADPGASRPGEPPKMRTGEGRYSIKAEVRQRGKQIVGRTYVDKKIARYMAMWEFRQDGQQRPFLKPGLMNNLRQFQNKVGAELKRAATPVAKKKAVNK